MITVFFTVISFLFLRVVQVCKQLTFWRNLVVLSLGNRLLNIPIVIIFTDFLHCLCIYGDYFFWHSVKKRKVMIQ